MSGIVPMVLSLHGRHIFPGMNKQIGKQILRRWLPGASGKSLDALLAILMQGCRPSGEPFAALLQEGCSPATIQSAILEFRDDASKGGRPGVDGLHDAMMHFDRLAFLLLQAVGRYWQERVSDLESRLSIAGSELRFASERNRWARDGEVTLYNYFREVPVMARVAIHDVRENGLAVERTLDLVQVVAAGQHGCFAHIRLSDLHSCLRLEVESSDGKLVHFRFAGIFRTAQERRQQIRVLCDDNLHLSLSDAAGAGVEAIVRDMSRSGSGLEARQPVSIRAGDQLDFQLELPSGGVQGKCAVCWLGRPDTQADQSCSGQVRFGVELQMTPAHQRRMQAEVGRRQKRILGALRIMGVPDSLI